MKQLQSDRFSLLQRIDVELTPLDSTQEQIIPGTYMPYLIVVVYIYRELQVYF